MVFGFGRRKKPADPQLWRQGDVFITRVESMPAAARGSPLRHGVLAHGELTGHSHRLDDSRSAALFAGAGHELFLDVSSGGTRIVHEEHGTIVLPMGLYRAWRQREYTPGEIRVVGD
jgi:hypothetical protein